MRPRADRHSMTDKASKLKTLRQEIGALEASETRFRTPTRLELPARAGPVSEVWADEEGQDPLASFRQQAGLHEVRPDTYLDGPLAFAFAALWLAGLDSDRPVLWVHQAGSRLDFGGPCPDGLMARGLDPRRLVRVRPRAMSDALWAMENGLKAGLLVLGEAGGDRCDLTATKRLHQAAKARATSLMLVRPHDASGPSAALTRWRVAPQASRAAAYRGAGGLPGPGSLRLRAVLERQRGGAPDQFELEWTHDPFCRAQPAPVADRPAAPVPRRLTG